METGISLKGRSVMTGLAVAVLLPALAMAAEVDRITVEDPATNAVKFKVTSEGNVTAASYIGKAQQYILGAGTLSVSGSSESVTGSGTQFTSQLHVGDGILVNGYYRAVSAISSDTSLKVVGVLPAMSGASFSYASTPVASMSDGDGRNYFTLTGGGFVGIGNSAPTKHLSIESSAQTSIMVRGLTGYGATVEYQNMTTPTAQGNWLGGFFFGAAHTGTTTYNAVEASAFADGAWTSGSSYPSGFLFKTTASGSTVRAERLRITSAGNVGIGSTAPSQKLEVNGGARLNTTATQPACDSTVRGTFWFTQGGSGVKDSAQVCAKDAANAYAWRTLY